MALVEFMWDLSQLGEPGKATLSAAMKAGGDAARAMRTEASRGVRARKRLKASRVRKALPVFFPKSKQDLVWRMPVSNVPTKVIGLAARQTSQGVTFGINKGKRSLIKGAFIATMKSGHTGVFRRRGASRLPIDEAVTTSVRDVFEDGGIIPRVYERAASVFRTSFDRLIKIKQLKAKK